MYDDRDYIKPFVSDAEIPEFVMPGQCVNPETAMGNQCVNPESIMPDQCINPKSIMGEMCVKPVTTKFPIDASVTMAYVPFQELCAMYEPMKALERGTIFPDLDKPFYGRGV